MVTILPRSSVYVVDVGVDVLEQAVRPARQITRIAAKNRSSFIDLPLIYFIPLILQKKKIPLK
jgi:hypothetical protein